MFCVFSWLYAGVLPLSNAKGCAESLPTLRYLSSAHLAVCLTDVKSKNTHTHAHYSVNFPPDRNTFHCITVLAQCEDNVIPPRG